MLSLLTIPAAAQTLGGSASVNGTAFVGQPTGTLAISTPSPTTTDTTIFASFNSNVFATPGMTCVPHAGGATHTAVDNGVDRVSPVSHQQIVAGLTPSTSYDCTASVTAGSTVTSTFTISTTATPSSTAITGLTLGSVSLYNSINGSNQGSGDTFNNCKSSDGSVYMTSDDNTGFTISGAPAYTAGGQQNVMKVLSESPLAIQTIQNFANYGAYNPLAYLSDGLSSKNSGIFCMRGNLFLAIGRQNQNAVQAGGGFAQSFGNITMSYDHGLTWNNPQNSGAFPSNPLQPLTTSMWPGSPSTMGSAAFIEYCADDGTLGYAVACNQHDNGNAFVYLVANEGSWAGGGSQGGGNVLYIARVPRAKLQNLSGSDWQWYVSGDGNLDANWTSTEASAGAMLTNSGELGTPNVQYIPAKNRYLMLTFYYPTGATNPPTGNKLNCTWLGYEAQHPWGPWTLVFTQNFSGAHAGDYNPVILNDTAYSGTTPTVMWTGNFVNTIDYVMRFATLTIN